MLSLTVGDCIDSAVPPRPAKTITVVDCAIEHDSEAFARVDLDEADFPGEDAVRSRAESECSAAFATFVGIDYEASSLDYGYYFPTAGSWAAGDRRILCLVLDPEGPVTGTLEGAAR